MNTLPGMPITVGRVTRPGSSSMDRVFIDLVDKRDTDDIGKIHVLGVDESKMTFEYGVMPMIPPVTVVWPVRLTNVDGQLVKTMFRRPRPKSA